MKVSSISPIQNKSMYRSKINSRQISNQYFEPNNYQSVTYFNNTNFMGVDKKEILLYGTVHVLENARPELKEELNKLIKSRIIQELGGAGVELLKKYDEQINSQAASLFKTCLTIPTKLDFLKVLYKRISHPIATTDHSVAEKRIPVYIELAKFDGKYRFTDEKVKKQLHEQFNSYMTEMDKIELLQELLKIGIENKKPLTAEEISDFLELTSGQTKEGQEKVIRYMKYSRDVLNFKPRERKSLEEFKIEFEKEKLSDPMIAKITSPEERYHAEDHLYNIQSSRKIVTKPKGFDPLSFIASSQIPEANNVIKQICASENPEKVADLVHEIGMNGTISESLCNLEEINEIVNNPPFIKKLSELYYLDEIFNIKLAMKKQVEKGVIYNTKDSNKAILQNTKVIDVDKIKISKDISELSINNFLRLRKKILKSLGIYEDVKMRNILVVPEPELKIYDGNFERGKRR